MDYTKTSLLTRLRKAARYVRLYGVASTTARVKAQYHMKRRYATLPPERAGRAGRVVRHVGFLGCGNFAFATIAHHLRRNFGAVIRGVMDIDIHRAASLFEEYDADYYTDSADRILDDPAIDLVYVVSNHASHAQYAMRALRAGKSVHIEKPQAMNLDELAALCAAMRESSGRVNLGFNRPASALTADVRRELAAQPRPGVYNWFVVGHHIPADHWYMRPEEGGRIVGNLCHWSDFLLQLVPAEVRYPIRIVPARAPDAAPDNDLVVTYIFGDGTVASIVFTAKGHTFEGVRERFHAHQGDAILSLVDFQSLAIEVVDRKVNRTLRHRDHGHAATVLRSYGMVRSAKGATDPGQSAQYVWETGLLYLETKRALEENRTLTIDSGSTH
jgi:predicted dehydrogenase